MADGRGGSTHPAVRHWIYFTSVARRIDPCRVCSRHQLGLLLLEEENLMMDFVMWLVLFKPLNNSISIESAIGYMQTVNRWHERHFGYQIAGTSDTPHLRDLLKGMRREIIQPPKRPRYGVRTQQLSASMNKVLKEEQGMSKAARKMNANWRAALACAFCALMRAGEFALADEKTRWDPELHLSRADVEFFYDDDGVLCVALMMRPLKKGKPTRGKRVRVILRSGGSLLDPVAELRRLFDVDPVSKEARASTPLFRSQVSNADKCTLTVPMVRDMVRLLMRSQGENPKRFGAHSLRIGGASAALAAKVHPMTIRAMGRWSSDMHEIYSRMSVEAAGFATSLIGSTAFHDLERGFRHEEFELLPEEVEAGPDFEDDETADAEEIFDELR